MNHLFIEKLIKLKPLTGKDYFLAESTAAESAATLTVVSLATVSITVESTLTESVAEPSVLPLQATADTAITKATIANLNEFFMCLSFGVINYLMLYSYRLLIPGKRKGNPMQE